MSQPSPGQVSLVSVGDNPNALYDSSTPEAIVTYGPVQIDDENALVIDPSALNNSIFDEYIINNRFEGDFHRYMMGLTSENPFQGASVAFVQLASPTVLWIADWTVLIKGSIRIPDPEITIPDWILLDAHCEPAAVVENPDGITPLYRISGTYVFGHKNPKSNILSNVIIPKMPWVKDGVFQTVILPSNLDNTLLTPQGGGGGSSAAVAPGQPQPNQTQSIKTIGN